ncbi:hypothetical protein CSOJ01_05245 [Colletotrichum sojae]|uniref:Glycosyl transferase family 8 n=1 Tax=Colletotrichum sojae TaxID=2175907 RepID=A0A8H6JGN4_9PEZI|nr:hypothetical protein CSOJ01_05245 [Colletotrichum sojae]
MDQGRRVVDSEKVWASLITKTSYLQGLLTLHHSLASSGTAYPFVALYTDSLPQEARAIIAARGIPLQRVDYLKPGGGGRDYKADPRFEDTWCKLSVFSLTGYERVVLLDADMLVRRNMDELMELRLDEERRVIAAGHVCSCNPLRKPHYPADWVPENCPFTSRHADPEAAQTEGEDLSTRPLGLLNSGLLVVAPSAARYAEVLARLETANAGWVFPDQELLADVFRGRWVPLPYVYNALKTLRWRGVHDGIWRDGEVRNVHYILSPKPWADADGGKGNEEETYRWWWAADRERRAREEARGIFDALSASQMRLDRPSL